MTRLPVAPLAACCAGLVVAGVAAAGGGGRAALSAGLGVVVVVGFFASGALPLHVMAPVGGGGAGVSGAEGAAGGPEQRAGLGAAVLLLTYTLRLAVAVAVLRVVSRSDAVDPRVTGIAVIVCALAWVVAQAVSVLRPDRAARTSRGSSDRSG